MINNKYSNISEVDETINVGDTSGVGVASSVGTASSVVTANKSRVTTVASSIICDC